LGRDINKQRATYSLAKTIKISENG
jgi:hypothetical protein